MVLLLCKLLLYCIVLSAWSLGSLMFSRWAIDEWLTGEVGCSWLCGETKLLTDCITWLLKSMQLTLVWPIFHWNQPFVHYILQLNYCWCAFYISNLHVFTVEKVTNSVIRNPLVKHSVNLQTTVPTDSIKTKLIRS